MKNETKKSFKKASDILDSLSQTRDELKQLIESLTPEELELRETADGWSVTEIIEHLGIVNQNVVRLIGNLLSGAEHAGKKSDGNLPNSFSLSKFDSAFAEKLKAPERVYPPGLTNVKESLERSDKSLADLRSISGRIEDIDAELQKFPHPHFGDLNLYEWLVVACFHESRHLEQIRRILAVSRA